MTDNYESIKLSVDEFFSYIGTPIVLDRKVSVLYNQGFDVEIKNIDCVQHNDEITKIMLPPTVIDLLDIDHSFSKSLMKNISDHFLIYFETEEDALYFKLKYCSC